MDERIVRNLIWKAINEVLPTRYCPTCEKETQMVLVQTEQLCEENVAERGRKFYRCLKCLGLFEESLVPVKKD